MIPDRRHFIALRRHLISYSLPNSLQISLKKCISDEKRVIQKNENFLISSRNTQIVGIEKGASIALLTILRSGIISDTKLCFYNVTM